MKILINRTDGLAASILTSSMAQVIKEHYPEAKIIFLVLPEALDVFKNHPYIDEVKVYHRKFRFYNKLQEIFNLFFEAKPTHYLYVGGGYLPNFMAWLFRISFRGGLKSRWHTYLFLNKGIRQKRAMTAMHEMEYNLNLLSPLGIKYNFEDKKKYAPEIHLSQDEIEASNNLFNKDLIKLGHSTGKKIIFIHPGSTQKHLNWSSRNYGRLIGKLEQKFPEKFLYIVTHTSVEHQIIQNIKQILEKSDGNLLKQGVHFFNIEKRGFRHFIGVLSQASLFVGPSTGTTHLASVLGIPTVGIYSPIKIQSVLRWGPLSKKIEKIKLLVPDVICGEVLKCAEKECPYYECMGKIEVEDVVKQAIAVMEL